MLRDALAGDSADLVFTDPPYNVDYEGYTEEKLKIKGDRMSDAEFKQFLEAAFRSYRIVEARRLAVRLPFLLVAARVPERAGGGRLRGPLPDHLGEEHLRLGLRPLQVPARADLLLPRRRPERPLVRRQIAIDAVAGEEAGGNRLHPTMKPVELIERALLNSSKAGDIVADLFGGSGSTLIGCERRGGTLG